MKPRGGDVAGVILAAGLGMRLRPLTDLRPKPLCPVNNQPLIDGVIERMRAVTDDIAVNVHPHPEQMRAHLGDAVHLSFEQGQPLGTAGAIGALLPWIDGRDLVVMNADSRHQQDLLSMMDGWDRTTIRLVTVHDAFRRDFGTDRYAGCAFMPFEAVRPLEPVVSGLYDTVWDPWLRAGRLELRRSGEPFFDCGTPAEYLTANMHASGGASVIGDGAVVKGSVERSVLWPGVVVGPQERLVNAIRARDDVTVVVEEA